MTQVCSLPSSTADVNETHHEKRLPKGIRVVGTDEKSAPKVEGISRREEQEAPWGYLFIQHYAAGTFDKRLEEDDFEGDFVPKCFIHRTVNYKQKPNGKGVKKEEKPSISGLIFLQGKTDQLRGFLQKYFPRYHLVNNCMTGQPASIQDSVMKPFMKVMETEPERVTFLRDPFNPKNGQNRIQAVSAYAGKHQSCIEENRQKGRPENAPYDLRCPPHLGNHCPRYERSHHHHQRRDGPPFLQDHTSVSQLHRHLKNKRSQSTYHSENKQREVEAKTDKKKRHALVQHVE